MASMESERQVKFSTIAYVVLILAILAGLAYYFLVANKGPQTITGLEVATKTASFLDKTITESGGMLAGFGCFYAIGGNCEPYGISETQPHLGQAIYGYYSLARVANDQSYRLKADRAMNYVMESCQTNVQMCAWNFFPLARYYFDTNEERYRESMLRPAEEFLVMSHEDIVIQNAGHKLASLYKATSDERYRTRLVAVADRELANWNPNQSGSSIQAIWSIFLPAYDITSDEKYLAISRTFFDSYNLADNYNQLTPTQAILKGADALLVFAEITGERAYRLQAKNVLQKALNALWDNPENPKVNGDYGFFELNPEGRRIVFKQTLNNGWFVKLFTILADEKFELPVAQES